MVRVTLGLILALFFATPLLAAEDTEEGWQTYIDDTYKVTLRFPSEWKRDPLIYQDRPYFSSEPKPHSVVHNFQLLVMGDEGTTPERACKGNAEHVLKPFGEKPTIHLTKVDGQSACLIFIDTAFWHCMRTKIIFPASSRAFISYLQLIRIQPFCLRSLPHARGSRVQLGRPTQRFLSS